MNVKQKCIKMQWKASLGNIPAFYYFSKGIRTNLFGPLLPKDIYKYLVNYINWYTGKKASMQFSVNQIPKVLGMSLTITG